MIEPLPGNDWLIDGDVRSADDVDIDWQPEHDDSNSGTLEDDVPREIAKTELLREDERVIDEIILGIHPKAPAKGLGRAAVERIFRAPTDPVEAPVEPGISHTAQEIVAQYQAEKARLEHFKRRPDLNRLRRNVWIAIIRNYQKLSEADRSYIEQAAELHEHNGHPVPPPRDDQPVVPRERDFRERQYRDD